MASSGAIGARLSSDAAQVRAMVGDSLALVVQNLATITAGLIIAFSASWRLALVVLSVVPLLGFAGIMQMKAIKGFAEDAKVHFLLSKKYNQLCFSPPNFPLFVAVLLRYTCTVKPIITGTVRRRQSSSWRCSQQHPYRGCFWGRG